MNELENRIAVITGAARGIGRGIALEMAKAGANCILVDIDVQGLEEAKHSFDEHSVSCTTIVSDVSSHEQNTALVERVVREHGRIDILVNNAGIGEDKSFLETNYADIKKVYETNLIGPFFLTQLIAKTMVEKNIEGSILFTSSTHSKITILRPGYSSSKAAIEMFVRDTALELSEFGIRVNAVAPGAIDVWAMEDRKSTDVPMGYLGLPEDIGKAMVFLASENSSYITGQTLVVDGAFSLAHTHYWKKKEKL
jgi:NAD(P)-dependent dehydrogenase (short-subunit alcohol dehydrogenase family)